MATEQKHTPGKWMAASGPSSIVGWPVVAQTGRLICNIATPPKDIDRIGKAKEEYDAFMAECEANARLIAAAPELLAAASWMEEFIHATNEDRVTQDQRDLFSSMMALTRAAIAKAEGR